MVASGATVLELLLAQQINLGDHARHVALGAEHRQRTDLVYGHQAGQLLELCVQGDRDHGGRHQLPDPTMRLAPPHVLRWLSRLSHPAVTPRPLVPAKGPAVRRNDDPERLPQCIAPCRSRDR
jgi:hypothetical protein